MNNNVFNLFEPQSFDCYLERYHSNLHVLRVRAERFDARLPDAENVVELVFTDVLYYEGALTWTGANFCTAPSEECLETLRKAGIIGDDSPEDIEETRETYALFTIQTTSGAIIKLVAHYKDFTMTVIE